MSNTHRHDSLETDEVPEAQPLPRPDAGASKDVRNKERRIQLSEANRISAIRGIMGEPEGRAFFWWLLGLCHVHHSSFNTNGLTMAFNEGARNVGLQLEAEIVRASEENFVLMMKEAKETQDA